MKAKTFLAIVFLCVSFGLAQAQSKMMFQGSGGVSIPTTTKPEAVDFYWKKMGFNIGGGFGYFLDARERVALQGNIDYNRLPFNENGAKQDIRSSLDLYISPSALSAARISGTPASFLGIFLGFRVNPSISERKIIPYLIGGVSLIRMSGGGEITIIEDFFGETVIEIETVDESRLGLTFGAGLSLNLNYRSGIFVEAGYSLISKGEFVDQVDDFDPTTQGLVRLKIGYFRR